VSLSLRRKDLVGPVTRVKKKKRNPQSHPRTAAFEEFAQLGQLSVLHLIPKPANAAIGCGRGRCDHSSSFFFFFTLVTGPRRYLSLKLSDTRVYEPQIRARLGTTAHVCKVQSLRILRQVHRHAPLLPDPSSLFFITLKSRVERYKSLRALNTSPPRNRFPVPFPFVVEYIPPNIIYAS